MTKDELICRFEEWDENGESEKIIDTIMELPDSALDDDIIVWLWGAYMDMGEYKRAVTVLETLRERKDGEYGWHYMLAATLFQLSKDEKYDEDEEEYFALLRRVKVELARTMNLNPPEDILEKADDMMAAVEHEMDDEDEDGYGEDRDDLELYDEEDADALEEHIHEYFGDFPSVFHEINSTDIHCDVLCVPPTEERNYYTLITMGMGAHIMDIPEGIDVDEFGRAELLICLPPNWKVGESDEEWFWPIRLLKDLAHLPINGSTWLGWGHSIDNRVRYAQNTDLCAALLLKPQDVDEDAESVTLPSGDIINFYQVIPIYREEMDYKLERGTQPLLEHLSKISHVVDIDRVNCCENYSHAADLRFDCADDHCDKIPAKRLPLDPINGCNHIAIFMRWCIEHDLVSPEFHEYRQDVIDGVLNGTQTDLRDFIFDYFNGSVELMQFNFVGAAFASAYYNPRCADEPPYFPEDVDKYAEEYFGTERYNSDEFKDEAYLFVPFDEEYYKGLSEYIQRAFDSFFPKFAEMTQRNNKRALDAVLKKLGLEGTLPRLPEMVPEELEKAVKEAEGKDYTPLLLAIDDAGPAEDPEELELFIADTMNPLLEAIAIVNIPGKDLAAWATENFTAKKPVTFETTPGVDEQNRLAVEKLGGIPAFLMYDEECSTLYLPLGDRYMMFTGVGFIQDPRRKKGF